MKPEHFDVLIMGAGLSGIGAAHHLQVQCPSKSYVILEQRGRVGGTWDLFRYPGVRSDSDMLTMSYPFRLWTDPKMMPPGDDIREYITAIAREEGIDRNIRFRHRINAASWSSREAQWAVDAVRTSNEGREEQVTLTCNFLFSCAGYYRYSAGHRPEFPGESRFAGRIVHPQCWPQDLNYKDKRVVIIGSGATAVTLLPAMAESASHVTMLQRSPTYVLSMPAQDVITNLLLRAVPAKWAYRFSRWKNIALMMFFYQLARRRPAFMKANIRRGVRKAIGPRYDVDTHFNPRYNPWEQRLCLVPDGDMFRAIKSGRASVVTDVIDTFTETGIQLKSGQFVEADIIVTATGLALETYGGINLAVDGRSVDIGRTLAYKGVMLSDVPNFAAIFGYINASWTLKADLIANYVCRLLRLMDRKGMRQVTARKRDEIAAAPFVENFSSGYIQRGAASWPKQGSKPPWRVHQNYILDTISLKWAPIGNRALEFSNPREDSVDRRHDSHAMIHHNLR